jgi:diacylglycerol kinase (ATP)
MQTPVGGGREAPPSPRDKTASAPAEDSADASKVVISVRPKWASPHGNDDNFEKKSEEPFFLWLINPNAGGQSGAGILKKLEKHYRKKGDGAAFSLFGDKELGIKGPGKDVREGLGFVWEVLDVFATIQRPLRVVAAGGDGTVVWIVNAIASHPGMTKRLAEDANAGPIMSVQALGTGNDMSRYLRWGNGLSSASDLHLDEFLKDCQPQHSETIQMNRWKIRVDPPPKNTTAFGDKDETIFMNYFSVGVDAKVAMDFEACRKSCSSCFCCPCINQMWYAWHGGKCATACYGCCTHISELATIHADGVDITSKIGGAASVVAVNIDSFSAGVDLWGSPSGKTADLPDAHDAVDGLLEIVGIGKVGDIGVAKVSSCCASFDRMAQAKKITYEVTEGVNMQVDGEAWLTDGPCKIEITQEKSIPMLRRKIQAEQK